MLILEELQKTTSHPTAVEVYEAVRRRMPKISLGTVYRNLDLLAGMGKIQKLDLGGSEARFDGTAEPHYHVRCVGCGRVDDVQAPPPGLVDPTLPDTAGYQILGLRLEFVGVCPRCQRRRETAGQAPRERVAPRHEPDESSPPTP
jgi:Fur family ferric uptake transcriptional regulator